MRSFITSILIAQMTCAAAGTPNPFRPDDKIMIPEVFEPAPSRVSAASISALPLPPRPSDTQPVTADVFSSPLPMQEPPALPAPIPSKPLECVIALKVPAPEVSFAGGRITMEFVRDRAGRQCVAGVHVAEEWATLVSVNSKQLILDVDQNSNASPRKLDLRLANQNESQVITVRQVAAPN